MPNVFLCIEWPLVIFLTIMAYRISKKKFRPNIAKAIAGITGIVAIFVIANIVGVWFNMGRFEISDIFWNVLQFMFSPMIGV